MTDSPGRPHTATCSKLFKTFFFIGATSFGGGVIAYLREHLVEREGWFDDDEFLAALEISQTLPGLNSTNMSVIAGTELSGAFGAIAALLGMIIPGTVAVLALGAVYSHYLKNPQVVAVLNGAAAASVGLLLAVTLQIGRKELENWHDLLFLVPAFVAVSLFHFNLLLVFLVLGPISVWVNRPRPQDDSPESEADTGNKPGTIEMQEGATQ